MKWLRENLLAQLWATTPGHPALYPLRATARQDRPFSFRQLSPAPVAVLMSRFFVDLLSMH